MIKDVFASKKLKADLHTEIKHGDDLTFSIDPADNGIMRQVCRVMYERDGCLRLNHNLYVDTLRPQEALALGEWLIKLYGGPQEVSNAKP